MMNIYDVYDDIGILGNSFMLLEYWSFLQIKNIVKKGCHWTEAVK